MAAELHKPSQSQSKLVTLLSPRTYQNWPSLAWWQLSTSLWAQPTKYNVTSNVRYFRREIAVLYLRTAFEGRVQHNSNGRTASAGQQLQDLQCRTDITSFAGSQTSQVPSKKLFYSIYPRLTIWLLKVHWMWPGHSTSAPRTSTAHPVSGYPCPSREDLWVMRCAAVIMKVG